MTIAVLCKGTMRIGHCVIEEEEGTVKGEDRYCKGGG